MNKYFVAAVAGIALVAVSIALFNSKSVAAQASHSSAVFDGFFTFGHHPLPYDETAAEAPATQCAGCHITFVSKTDMTWVQFYPMLREKHN